VDEYSWRKLRARYVALGKAYLELSRSFQEMTEDIAFLRAELREAQNELARLRAIDAGQRLEREPGAPLQ
jgi:hypothetical protein